MYGAFTMELKYKQLFCAAPTKLYKRNNPTPTFSSDKIKSVIPPFRRGVIFENFPCTNDTVFYLCEYPRKILSDSQYVDSRTQNIIDNSGSKEFYDFVERSLMESLNGDCVLVAIPSLYVENNFKTSMHQVIRDICSKIYAERQIIDGSQCLERTKSLDPHEVSDKEFLGLVHTKVNHKEKLWDKHVVLMGNVFNPLTFDAYYDVITWSVPVKSISYFSVGLPLRKDNLNMGVILDLDSLFLQLCRETNQPGDNSKFLFNREKNHYIEFIKGLIRSRDFDFRLVTSMPLSDVMPFAEALGIPYNYIVSFEDTNYHKPSTHPYLFAKQQMQIYDPFIVVVGDSEESQDLARKLGMKSLLVTQNNCSTLLTQFYKLLNEDMKDLCEAFGIDSAYFYASLYNQLSDDPIVGISKDINKKGYRPIQIGERVKHRKKGWTGKIVSIESDRIGVLLDNGSLKKFESAWFLSFWDFLL